jgi:hypothetical protein
MAQLNVVPAQLPATATLPTRAPHLERQPPPMETLERANMDAAKEYQAYYDEALCRRVGVKAPEPGAGQDVNDYRCESLRTFKRMFLPQNHELYQVQYRALRDDHTALRALEPQLLSACVIEAYNPQNVERGKLKEVTELNSFGQPTSTRFVGQESFVKLPNFGTDIRSSGGHRPGRRVISFNTPNGPMDSTGRFMRR